MSTVKFNKWLNTDNTENYRCRAWINFDGTTSTPTIRASGNISSITDNGAGDYTLNFTTALTTSLPDANYAVAGAAGNDGEMLSYRAYASFVPTTSSVRVASTNAAGTRLDSAGITVVIFR